MWLSLLLFCFSFRLPGVESSPGQVLYYRGRDRLLDSFVFEETVRWLVSSSLSGSRIIQYQTCNDSFDSPWIELESSECLVKRRGAAEASGRIRFPAVAVPLHDPERSVALLGLGHSDKGQLSVVKSLLRDHGSILCLIDSDSVSLVFACQNAFNWEDWKIIEHLAENRYDAFFAHCVSLACYRNLMQILNLLLDSHKNTDIPIVLTEELTIKIYSDVAFWTKANTRKLEPEFTGITRRLPRSPLVKELANVLENAANCSRNSDALTNCNRQNKEETLIRMFYLNDAFLVLNSLMEVAAIRGRSHLTEIVSSFDSIVFDPDWLGRIHPQYDVVRFTENKREKIARYVDGELLWLSSPKRRQTRSTSPSRFQQCLPAEKRNSKYHFKITTIEEPPFVYYDPQGRVNPSDFHTENHLTGLVVDLAEKLSNRLDFTYDISLVPDDEYGTVEEASGMIGQLLNCTVDLCIAPMTITDTREEYVDFTHPWLDIGLILFTAKPKPKGTDLFAFMDPFTNDMWGGIVISWVVVSVAVAVLQYVIVVSPRRKWKTRAGRAFDLFRLRTYKAGWHLYASAMQQGAEGVNRFATRIAVGGWFLFALIIISTYTANLAAFLTVQKIPDGITSADQLAAQTEVAYGTVRHTAVESFFHKSNIPTYSAMGKFMQVNPSAMVNNTIEGIERARSDNDSYVFVWDSPILEFYASRTPCNGRTVGRKFNNQGYGVVMPHGMPYLKNFSLEVLRLRKDGWIDERKPHWLVTGECAVGDGDAGVSASDVNRIGFEHLTGVFVVLAASVGVAFAVAVFTRIVVATSVCEVREKAANGAEEETRTTDNGGVDVLSQTTYV
ncbi:uncharacterized protein [Oscarella lobularis]|uniref:uncharacterized protein isoform X2 n=1 Tax=Oscarella lobularis TaxID=121494 RepID=UPI0033135797